ncbi:MAG: DUF1573 domain-containing protein [Holophagales bacterium]|jgi:hypothetical protein|nr:DUF1573 domain-containing protein [Holophagales bacterium]
MRVFYGFFLIAAVCLAQAPEPRIAFDAIHHDFGRVLRGQKVSHKYKAANNGDAPLQIKEIQVSCGCSSAILGQRSLLPGESTFIEVQYDSSGDIGAIRKGIDVILSDPANPTVGLTFEANVVREVMPSRTVVFFDAVPRSGSASETIRLESGIGQTVTVKEIKVPVPYLECEQQLIGNDVLLDVKINGKLIPKHASKGQDVLIVHTTSCHDPILRFNIFWETASPIIVSPKQVTWSAPSGSELRASVAIAHSSDLPFRMLKAKSTSRYIKAINIGKHSAAKHTIIIVMTAKTKPGMYREKLTMNLDDPNQSILEIDVIAALR